MPDFEYIAYGKMERQKLLEFIQQHGTSTDKVNLLILEDFKLRSIVQRLMSEQRMAYHNSLKKVVLKTDK